MLNQIKRLLKDESGPTAVEYALMLVLVALAIALALPSISEAVIAVFNAMATALSAA